MKTWLRMAFLFLVSALLLAPVSAWSHPTYMRLGYVNCAACHVSPQGAGQLTNYGRGISDSASLVIRDDEASSSDWVRGLTAGGRILHGFQTRIMGVSANGRGRIFPMQLDYLNNSRLDDRFTAGFTIGKAPSGTLSSGKGALGTGLVLRKAFIAFRPEEGTELSLGRDYLPVGLNIEDHTSFLRSAARRGIYDYVTQLRLDTWVESSSFTAFLYAPSFEENTENREYGGGVRAERTLGAGATLGLLASVGSAPALRRLFASAFSRLAINDRLGLLAEYQLIQRWVSDGTGFGQAVLHLRPFFFPAEWLETGFTAEFLHRGAPFTDRAIQYGPSVSARLIRQVTLRVDGRLTERQSQAQKTLSIQLIGTI